MGCQLLQSQNFSSILADQLLRTIVQTTASLTLIPKEDTSRRKALLFNYHPTKLVYAQNLSPRTKDHI